MSKAAIALLVFAGLFIVLLGYDAYLFIDGGTEATISWFLYEASYEKPIMTFLVGNVLGILAGHCFWQMKPTKRDK
jgi:hypothetical protein